MLTCCSQTKYLADPIYGVAFRNSPTVLVAVHENGMLDEFRTNRLLKELVPCEALIQSLTWVSPKVYRSYFDMMMADSLKLDVLAQNVDADFFLLGSFKNLESNESNGVLNLSYIPSVKQNDLKASNDPKSIFEFILFDLHLKKMVLELITTTESLSFSFPAGGTDHEYQTYPGSSFIQMPNFKKATKKIKKLCHCL